MQSKEDITTVVYDYLKRSHEQGAIYTELMVSPEHFSNLTDVYAQPGAHKQRIRKNKLSYDEVIDSVAKAIDKAKQNHGIESRILIVILRHKGVNAAKKLLTMIINHPHPYVRGINLAGDDIHFPAQAFKDVYTTAKEHGLQLSAHMGEHTGAKDIQTAINMNLDRIGHGLSVIDNKQIMNRFKQSGIGIEVCPSSNIDEGNGTFKSMSVHPLKKMLENNLLVSISTDDPSFLHTDIEKEYVLVKKSYQLSNEKMIQLCENSIKMSFAEKALKDKLLHTIAVYRNSHKRG